MSHFIFWYYYFDIITVNKILYICIEIITQYVLPFILPLIMIFHKFAISVSCIIACIIIFLSRYLKNVSVEGDQGKPNVEFTQDGVLKAAELKIMNLRPGVSKQLVWEEVRLQNHFAVHILSVTEPSRKLLLIIYQERRYSSDSRIIEL